MLGRISLATEHGWGDMRHLPYLECGCHTWYVNWRRLALPTLSARTMVNEAVVISARRSCALCWREPRPPRPSPTTSSRPSYHCLGRPRAWPARNRVKRKTKAILVTRGIPHPLIAEEPRPPRPPPTTSSRSSDYRLGRPRAWRRRESSGKKVRAIIITRGIPHPLHRRPPLSVTRRREAAPLRSTPHIAMARAPYRMCIRCPASIYARGDM